MLAEMLIDLRIATGVRTGSSDSAGERVELGAHVEAVAPTAA